MNFKHIIPKTEDAQRFHDKYGGILHVEAEGVRNGNPVVAMNTCNHGIIVIERRDTGIYIDDEYFGEWEE